MPIYRRGALYWLRRNPPQNGDKNPITVRISLRTACTRTAKARAAALELEWDNVATTVQANLRPMMTREDLARVYHLAVKAELDRIIVKQTATPMHADAHASANRTYANLFAWIAQSPRMPVPDGDLVDDMVSAGFDRDEAEKVHMALQLHVRRSVIEKADLGMGPPAEAPGEDAHEISLIEHHLAPTMRVSGAGSPITSRHLAMYLSDAGVLASDQNRDAAIRVVAAAYRSACLMASELMGRPIEPETVWPLPGNLLGMLGIEAPTTAPRSPSARSGSSTVEAVRSKIPGEIFGGRDDVPLTELAKAAIALKVANKDWQFGRARDVDAAVNLFVAANGDLKLSQISQRSCAAMVALFPRLPSRYGHTKQDIEGGLSAVLRRGDELAKVWKENTVRAELDGVPTVGLSAVTHNKHIGWISALFDFAEGHGYVVPPVNLSKLRRKDKGKKGGKRLPWKPDELRTLVSGPIWEGCAGLWRRFEPGGQVYHDGAYWAPLMLVTSGARSEEPTGCMLADIFDEAPVPYVHLRVNAYRQLKNSQSERKLPISPTLIRLGFLDYVKAMRALGHELLFPEFFNPAESMSFDHIFYDRVFEPQRKLQFPEGTSQMRDRKDVDVHSIRTCAATYLRDHKSKFDPGLRQYLLGHAPDGETARSYELEPAPEILLDLVIALDELIPPLPIFPLNLRPAEWQKFGSPRGRRRQA